MSSSPTVAAPSPDANSGTPPPPSPTSTSPPPSSSPSPPPPPSSSPSPPPPPSSSPSPPPPASSSPSPKASPPPPEDKSPSPPPPSNNASPPPPPNNNNSSPSPPPPTDLISRPPPPHSSAAIPPPPPPPSENSPPSNSTTSDSPNTSSSTDAFSSSTKQLIVGATVGLGLFLLAMVVVCVICAKKKKRKRDHDRMQYYGDPSHGRKDNMYYNGSQNPNWHMGPQGSNHVVRLNPSTPGAMTGSPHGTWPSPPPPLPPLNSGEMMSANFSGPRHPPLPPPSPALSLGFNKNTFTYDELAAATGGFSQANLLGQGGFGYVHKGILANGKEVAVKSLKSGSGQGEREFQAEVEIISRVHHRHLVSLVGYCIAGGQRMLVYEFVPNGTLEHHLYGKDLPTMDWPTRLRIATGSAKGLAYLHEDCHPRIIHRDIKTANILLDWNFEAMVADFGLAKLSSDNYTHVSTRVMGTFGYLAPEYASSGKLTEKSDVFSYGVMLLELITGRRPVDPSGMMDDSLVDWARPLLQRSMEDGIYEELVDPRLDNNYNPHEMARMIASAAASIRHSARKRPKMSQIVRALEGDVSLDDLNEGVRPGQSSIYTSSGSSDYDANTYNADMKKFRKMALTSQEFVSSEFGTSSSDSRETVNPGNQKQQHI